MSFFFNKGIESTDYKKDKFLREEYLEKNPIHKIYLC